MKVVFKTSELNSPLEIFSGTNINSYGNSTKRLISKKISINFNISQELILQVIVL